MESSLAFAPDFSKSGGLIAAVAQDAETLDVLMLAWMNPEAWEKTLETGEAHYYSRSRKCLWHKGGTSGHVQKVKSIRLDCDGDAVVLLIEQIGGAMSVAFMGLALGVLCEISSKRNKLDAEA